jgi:hypothetical protein
MPYPLACSIKEGLDKENVNSTSLASVMTKCALSAATTDIKPKRDKNFISNTELWISRAGARAHQKVCIDYIYMMYQ